MSLTRGHAGGGRARVDTRGKAVATHDSEFAAVRRIVIGVEEASVAREATRRSIAHSSRVRVRRTRRAERTAGGDGSVGAARRAAHVIAGGTAQSARAGDTRGGAVRIRRARVAAASTMRRVAVGRGLAAIGRRSIAVSEHRVAGECACACGAARRRMGGRGTRGGAVAAVGRVAGRVDAHGGTARRRSTAATRRTRVDSARAHRTHGSRLAARRSARSAVRRRGGVGFAAVGSVAVAIGESSRAMTRHDARTCHAGDSAGYVCEGSAVRGAVAAVVGRGLRVDARGATHRVCAGGRICGDIDGHDVASDIGACIVGLRRTAARHCGELRKNQDAGS